MYPFYLSLQIFGYDSLSSIYASDMKFRSVDIDEVPQFKIRPRDTGPILSWPNVSIFEEASSSPIHVPNLKFVSLAVP